MILADIHLSNINTETRLSFFQYVSHNPRNDVNTSAKNAMRPFAHLAFLPIFTRNMYSEIFHARKEIITDDTKELEKIVVPSYSIIVQKEESYATTLEKDYQTLKQF